MLSLSAAAMAPLRTMSQKVSPGAWWVIMATFRRGVVAACGACAPTAAGACVACDGAPPPLQAMATVASPPAHTRNNERFADTPRRVLVIQRVSLARCLLWPDSHYAHLARLSIHLLILSRMPGKSVGRARPHRHVPGVRLPAVSCLPHAAAAAIGNRRFLWCRRPSAVQVSGARCDRSCPGS